MHNVEWRLHSYYCLGIVRNGTISWYAYVATSLPTTTYRVPHNVITFLGLSERELFVAAAVLLLMMRGKNFTYCSSDLHGCLFLFASINIGYAPSSSC